MLLVNYILAFYVTCSYFLSFGHNPGMFTRACLGDADGLRVQRARFAATCIITHLETVTEYTWAKDLTQSISIYHCIKEYTTYEVILNYNAHD